MHMYGVPDHDTRAFHARFGADVPVGGFFCSGEIGPVGATTCLHGFTSSFGLIGPRAPTNGAKR
jgi:small ligand-binding sensory domain FIST